MIPSFSPFKKGDKVVAYCRYSEGDEQGLKNQSTEEQADAIRAFCDANELQLVRVFADPFASGRSVAKRDHYLEMLSFLLHKKKPDVQGVVLWDFERYGRNYDRAQMDAARLRMAGYKLFSLQQPISDDGPFAHVLESMYFASAQNQSDMISADVKRALQHNFQTYKVIPRSNIPDGWRAVPVHMGFLTDGSERIGYRAEPDPDYLHKIRVAINERLNGASVGEMMQIIGGKFSYKYSKVCDLMAKPLLYGEFTYGGTTIEEYCTPVITRKEWEKLQKYNESLKTKVRKRAPGSGSYSKNRTLLSGLLVCGVCGKRMYNDKRSSKGHVYETYRCNLKHAGVRREKLEKMVIDAALDLLTGEVWKVSSEKLIASFSVTDQTMDKAAVKREVSQIDRKLDRLSDAVADGGGSRTILAKISELEARKESLQMQLNAGPNADLERIRDMTEKMRIRIIETLKDESASVDDKRSALALFIPRITLYNGCDLLVEHGLPGYSGVASESAISDERPQREGAYTRKHLLRTVLSLHEKSANLRKMLI